MVWNNQWGILSHVCLSRSHRLVYQGFRSDFLCFKWAEWLCTYKSHLSALAGRLVSSAGWPYSSKGLSHRAASCSTQSSSVLTGESTGRKHHKMGVTSSSPVWHRGQQGWDLQQRSSKQQICLTSDTAWQSGPGLTLSRHLSPDTCT